MKQSKRRGFRLFISSTFEDFSAERDALHNGVCDANGELILESPFATLRRKCLGAETTFHVVDLRWGISASASTSYTTMQRCLDEVERACSYPSPNMLALIGDRYGWRPLPETITVDEFEQIRTALPDRDLQHLLERWYELETNSVPATYRVRDAASRPPQASERILQGALAKLSETLPLTTPAHYRVSATEREIEIGLNGRQAGKESESLLVYLRTIRGLGSAGESLRYRDLLPNGDIDRQAAEQVESLKRKLNKDPRASCRHYTLSWSDKGLTDHQRYLIDFCRAVQTDLELRVQQALTHQELDLDTAHESFANSHRRHFMGRASEQAAIRDYLTKEAAAPLLVSGPAGTGKTALLAWAAESAAAAGARITQRYIGITPNTSSGAQLAADISATTTDALSAAQQLAALRRHLTESADRPYVLLLDGLDLLPADDRLATMGWLPDPWPGHLRIIASTRDMDQLRQILETQPTTRNLQLGPLHDKAALQLFDTLLSSAGRSLTPQQTTEIRRSISKCARPLFIRLLADLAATWSSRDRPQIDARDIASLIEYLFNHLSSEVKHGSVLVTYALGYLAASRYGMSDDELLAVLSENDKVMSSFRQRHPDSPQIGHLPYIIWAGLHADLSPYLSLRHTTGADVLDFYHRELDLAARARLESEMPWSQAQLALAKLFRMRGSDLEQHWNPHATREALESGYHLLQADAGDAFDDYILDPAYLLAAVQHQGHRHLAGRSTPLHNPAGGLTGLLEMRAAQSPLAASILQSVLRSSDLLTICPSHLAQEIANEGIALRSPSHCKGSRLIRLEPGRSPPRDHSARITALAVAEDGTLIAAGDADGRVSLRRSSGELLWCRAGHDKWITSVALSPNAELVASAGDDGSAYIWHGSGAGIEPIGFPTQGTRLRQASALTFLNERTLIVLWGGHFYRVNIDTLRAELLPGEGSNIGFGVAHADALEKLDFGPRGTAWAEAMENSMDLPAKLLVVDPGSGQSSAEAILPGSPTAMALGSRQCLVSTALGLHRYRLEGTDRPTRLDIAAPIMQSLAADPYSDAFAGLSIAQPQLHLISAEGVRRSLTPRWPSLRHDDRPRLIKLMPGAELAVVGWLSGEIHLLSLRDGTLQQRWTPQPRIVQGAITPHGEWAVGLSPRPGSSQPAELNWIGRETARPGDANPHADRLVGATSTAEGELVTADRTGKLAIWAEASLVSRIDLKMALSAIGEWHGGSGIAVTTPRGETHLIGPASRRIDFGSMGFSRRLPLQAIDASGDPPLVVCGMINGLVGLWQDQLEWWRPDEDDYVDTTEICAVCLVGTTAFAAGNSDGRVRVWDRATGQLRFDWDPHRGAVIDLVALDNGERILSAAADGTLFVLDATSGRVICGTFIHDGVACVRETKDGNLTLLSQAGRLLRFILEEEAP
ncbi:MAG: AAA family ATPase [Candidatus Thiodiazotropha sp.]